MGFSPPQQGVYRPLLKKAWEIHCGRNGLNPKDKVTYEIWYRGELMKAIGKDSTKFANKSRDFDACRDHFTAICGDSIAAAMELTKQDSKRIIYVIGQICKKHTIHDAYVLGTARNITKTPSLSNLHQIEDPEQLQKVRVALIIHAKRLAKVRAGQAVVSETEKAKDEEDGNPF